MTKNCQFFENIQINIARRYWKVYLPRKLSGRQIQQRGLKQAIMKNKSYISQKPGGSSSAGIDHMQIDIILIYEY